MTTYPKTFFRGRRTIRAEIDAFIKSVRADSTTGLHLGCGDSYIPGMINCDAFSEKADRKLDASNLADFSDGSVDLIESHHMLEHLSFSEAENAFQEWRRVLRSGGRLIITCPDLNRMALKWVLRPSKRTKLLPMLYGSQEHPGMFHRSGYNKEILFDMLARHDIAPEFFYAPYPARSTPSLIVIGRRR